MTYVGGQNLPVKAPIDRETIYRRRDCFRVGFRFLSVVLKGWDDDKLHSLTHSGLVQFLAAWTHSSSHPGRVLRSNWPEVSYRRLVPLTVSDDTWRELIRWPGRQTWHSPTGHLSQPSEERRNTSDIKHYLWVSCWPWCVSWPFFTFLLRRDSDKLETGLHL